MNFDGSQFTPNFSHTALPISHILTSFLNVSEYRDMYTKFTL